MLATGKPIFHPAVSGPGLWMALRGVCTRLQCILPESWELEAPLLPICSVGLGLVNSGQALPSTSQVLQGGAWWGRCQLYFCL